MLFACTAASAFSPERFVRDARAQIWKTLYYDSSYARIPYPMGDVPIIRGVCTDVVIRALRPQGIDLQQLVHEDMQKNFRLYPNSPRWGMRKPDTNIDHRRVLNLQRYFARRGYAVTDKTFLPGDIVTWNLRPQVEHIGIVSDRKDASRKRPLIIHNIGYGTREEDMLYDFRITGHYRIAQGRQGQARHSGDPVQGEVRSKWKSGTHGTAFSVMTARFHGWA
jgi:uncharacterized protein YijF (DUF1287 family)